MYKSKHQTQQSYAGRTLVLGETKGKRLLTIVISYIQADKPYVVSARDMSRKERKYYYEQTKSY